MNDKHREYLYLKSDMDPKEHKSWITFDWTKEWSQKLDREQANTVLTSAVEVSSIASIPHVQTVSYILNRKIKKNLEIEHLPGNRKLVIKKIKL
jgi:hypothetical protein